MTITTPRAPQQTATPPIKASAHPLAPCARWWLGMFSARGRKADNQDSVLITTCLPLVEQSDQAAKADHGESPHGPKWPDQPLPLLVLLADGVSACQFPKQASQLAVDTAAQEITLGLSALIKSAADDELQATKAEGQHHSVATIASQWDEEAVASLIKLAVRTANDALYFSQAYQRVPPLLTTLSGLLCIGDRIHLFHTGDSRIYRVGADSLTVLSHDHRIHHGQDKGALSAALGADTEVDLQQSVFTLHQNESLVLMTDGVYEHIDAAEMQFELCAATARIFEAEAGPVDQWQAADQLSHQLCDYAYKEGSSDNLSMIVMGMSVLTPIDADAQAASNAPVWHHQDKLSSMAVSSMSPPANGQTIHQTQTANQVLNQAPNQACQDTISPAPSTKVTRYQLPTGLEVGDQIDGFRVMAIIARTARSEVYLVQDSDQRQFVLKSPSVNTVDDGNYLREFLKERKIGLSLSKHRRTEEAAYNQADPNRSDSAQLGLNHPYVRPPQGIGSGLSESGLLRYYPVPASSPYLYHLTEYIDGESLRVFIDRHAPCDVWQTHDLLTKIGMAVRVMHRNYLLHQDIKPENILLTKSGAVKLIDFGSASSAILKDSTRPPGGDLHYAAPEYYSDAPKGVHSDLFSIGIIGFELLTGERPFSAQTLMTPRQKLVVPTQLLRQQQVPEASQQALLRALHPHPNARYQAIGEFLQDFNPDNSAALLVHEPLIKRNPLLVWHGICLIEGIIIVILLIKLLSLS